jgi:hypothetical protein
VIIAFVAVIVWELFLIITAIWFLSNKSCHGGIASPTL